MHTEGGRPPRHGAQPEARSPAGGASRLVSPSAGPAPPAVSASALGSGVRAGERGIAPTSGDVTVPLLKASPQAVPHTVAALVWPEDLPRGEPPPQPSPPTPCPAPLQVLRGLAYLREKHQIMHRGETHRSPRGPPGLAGRPGPRLTRRLCPQM